MNKSLIAKNCISSITVEFFLNHNLLLSLVRPQYCMYRRSGKPQDAIQAFDKAIEIDPKHEPSRLNKGIVLLHDMQDFDGAIAAWEELLAVNPIAMAPTGRSVDEMIQQIKKQKGQMGPGATD